MKSAAVGCCATFANVTDLELLCSCCELWSIPNVKQSFFFCGLKVNWLGEVKCSAVIPEISPRFPQLPVISVVRETETQLLPDVGAIVTCKVWSESFQRISKVVVFGFVRGVIGFTYLIRWPASTPDTPRSTSCMWAPHRWRTASGGQSGTRGAPSHTFYSTAASLKTESWLIFAFAEKKMCAQQKRTRWAGVPPVRLFFVFRYRWRTTSLRMYFFISQVETYKSFRPGDIVLAKVVSFTRCGSQAGKWFHCLRKVIRAANQAWNCGYYDQCVWDRCSCGANWKLVSLLLMLDRWRQISLGDVQSNYLLTTAENELGVVVAHSESGKATFFP